MPDATLDASYHAYRSVPNRRPDKAFTPHPAVGAQCLMRRLTRLIMPTSLCRTVGRIRHVTNRAPEILTGSPRAPLTHQPTAQRLPAWRSPSPALRLAIHAVGMKRVQAYRNIAKSLDKRRQFFDVLQIIHRSGITSKRSSASLPRSASKQMLRLIC